MKHFLFFILFFSYQAQSYVYQNSSQGLGLEQLMNGVGQARLGSTGALGSNPALLAWLAKKNEFTSTNAVSFYKFQGMDGTNIRVSPDVVPRIAASSEGFGNWGHSWGIMIDQQKLSFSGVSGAYDITSDQQTQSILLAYALGYKINSNHALGISFNLGRFQEEISSTSSGEEVGVESIVSAKSKTSFWTQGFTLGWASGYKDWAFGASGKFSVMKFGINGQSDFNGYSETNNSRFSDSSKSVENIKLSSNFRLGLQRRFERSKLFYDVDVVPEHTDRIQEDKNKTSISHLVGYESRFFELMHWYSGLTFTPKNSATKDSGTASFGLSKRGKHSTQFGGVNWTRELHSASNQIYRLIFGTKFEY